MANLLVIPVGKIEPRIRQIRGLRVLLDSDLAELYGVPTFRLNEQSEAQPEPLSGRLHVPAQYEGSKSFDIAICDVKNRQWR